MLGMTEESNEMLQRRSLDYDHRLVNQSRSDDGIKVWDKKKEAKNLQAPK